MRSVSGKSRPLSAAEKWRRQPMCSFGGYRFMCWPWWKDLFWWLTRGWWLDIRRAYSRAVYGWNDRDTFSFDHYLAAVLAGGLQYMAETSHGSPGGYPLSGENVLMDKGGPITDHERWEADLRKWANAFAGYARHDYYEIHGNNYAAWNADEQARTAAAKQALREMAEWFPALWT